MLRHPVFNHRLHLRLIVESVIQNGYKPGLSEQPTYIKTNVTQTQHTPHSNSEYPFIHEITFLGKGSH